ncbi:uncharacterized protein (TIGR02246 family) [Pseudoduganella flava]|uniref:DUF4440 domain-containing protein n=1 Tax=Pseudoduganella flava TaxID=871742 RepID=A0A562Q0V4_9BURK|nr:nuclear transport factor 2 family protein [Pseudoduganella flava]QGZ38200.1 DUF4440 domain-containing protein [Pseudoduganella flava]TWI50273.1 uncharacterized protein (TIGR02246 family) [Pseudoduganella flava]
MSELNKSILQQANAAVRAGDNEGFLAFCTEDVVWSTVGGDTLHGKAAVRAWMATECTAPPEFTVDRLIADGENVVALGHIVSLDGQGKRVRNAYCDVWHVRDGKLAALQAYVIPVGEPT